MRLLLHHAFANPVNHARFQLDRLKRYLVRVEEIGASALADDDLIAFSQQAWNMRDNTRACLRRAEFQAFDAEVDAELSLSICSDLANLVKHGKPDRNAKVGAQLTHKHIHASDGAHSGLATARHTITLSDSSRHDALAVAREAVAAWEKIISKHGL